MELDMVADMEVNKLAEIVTNMVADNFFFFKIDIDINIYNPFGEGVGHGGWLIGPKLFWPEA